MTSTDRASALDALLLQAEVERFFSAEAELLDERRFDEWLDLLHEDIRYWMPIARNVRFDRPEREYTRERSEANWFDEGKDILRKRVLQIQGGDHWAEEPRSRTTHLVANVRVDADGRRRHHRPRAASWFTPAGSTTISSCSSASALTCFVARTGRSKCCVARSISIRACCYPVI